MERARHPFPAEPIRTLDAIHLESALAVRSAVPGVEFLSLDGGIRRTVKQLGFRLGLSESTLLESDKGIFQIQSARSRNYSISAHKFCSSP